MKNPPRPARTAALFVAGGIALATFAACSAVEDTPAESAQSIIVITPNDASEKTWQQLLDLGYRGDPTDKAEQLYIPTEVFEQVCDPDTDCEALD